MASATNNTAPCYLYDYGVVDDGANVRFRGPYYKVVMTIVCCFITLFGILGNTMVIVVICRRTNIRNTVNIALLNLAICDLLFVAICVPILAYDFVAGDWWLSEVFCKLFHYLMHITVFMTIYILVLVSILRYLTIVHGSVTAKYRTQRNITLSLAFLWAFVLIANCPVILIYLKKTDTDKTALHCYKCRVSKDAEKPLYLSFVVSSYLLPLAIIVPFYIAIWRYLKQQQNHMGSEHSHHGPQHRLKENTLRVLRIFIILVLVFGICWLPLEIHCLLFYFGIHPKSNAYAIFSVTAHFFAYSNSCLNPIIYNYTSTDFREDFRRVCRLPCRRAYVVTLDKPVMGEVEAASHKHTSDSRV